MFRSISLLATFVLFGTSTASGIVIEQLNEALSITPDNNYWTYNPDDGAITIHAASATETYVFWAHENGDPDTLASISFIAKHASVTSGTIKVRVSKSLTSLVPGATDIGAITFDTQDITSIIEGIRITGDLFTDAASAVDHVTGRIHAGGSLKNSLSVHEDMEATLDIDNAIESNVEVAIGGNLLAHVLSYYLDGHVKIAGDVLIGGKMLAVEFGGTIEIDGNVESLFNTYPIVLYEFLGGTLRVKRASVAGGGSPGYVLWIFINQQPFDVVFTAKNPRYFGSPMNPFAGGGAADTDHTFDITITQPEPQGGLAATIVLNDPGSPSGQFDLWVPMDLTSLTLAPELLEDPYPYLHNLYVAGDVNIGAEEFAIDIPDAAVNSIYIGGELGSEDGEENLFDRVRVASIGTLAFGSLGSEDFYVPQDGQSLSGTPIIVADEFLRSNDFIQQFTGTLQPSSFHYSHADSTGSPAGFTRNYQGATSYVSFYHRNPSDECILDTEGPFSWCCAKGPVTDINNSGVVNLTDFTLFALCVGLSSPSQDCPSDQFAHCDLDLSGEIDLSDFAIFSVAFAADVGDNEPEDDCCASPPCTEGEADLEFLQEFLEETIEPLISGDNDWVAAIQALTAEIAAFEPEEEYEGIVDALDAINFKPVAVDSAVSVAKNGSKIMSLGTSSDPDGDTLLRDLVTTDPAHGTLSEGVYDFDGNLISFRYTPDTDYTGPDTLTWRATEVGTTQEYYDEAVITITVTE